MTFSEAKRNDGTRAKNKIEDALMRKASEDLAKPDTPSHRGGLVRHKKPWGIVAGLVGSLLMIVAISFALGTFYGVGLVLDDNPELAAKYDSESGNGLRR